jgi:hypothetical protein
VKIFEIGPSLLAICDQRHFDVGNVAAGVYADNWQYGRIDLLKDLRVGNFGAASLLKVSVLLFLVLGLCFAMLSWKFVLASHVCNFDVRVKNEVGIGTKIPSWKRNPTWRYNLSHGGLTTVDR